MDHKDVEHNLQDAHFEDLRCSLDLAEEQLEGVQSHPPGDKTTQAQTNETSLPQNELTSLDSRDDEIGQDTFQSGVFLERL